MLLKLALLALPSLINGSYLQVNISRDAIGPDSNNKLYRRDGDGIYYLNMTEQQNFYSVEVELGNPIQKLQLLLDTGSSDMIVVSNSNPYCSKSNNCALYGTFNSDASTSYTPKDKDFKITYADGTGSAGEWGSDIVSFSNENVEMPLTFGLAKNSDSMGVLGIGLPGLEVSRGSTSGSFSYNNFPMQLKQQGIIDTQLYSLSLNKDKSTGNLLFGAVDTSEYTSGQLFTLPMINRYKSRGYANPIKMEITLQGLGRRDNSNLSESKFTFTTSKLPALIDSGSTIIYLPNEIATSILNEAGATLQNDHYSIECSMATDEIMNNKLLVFDFGGFQISIPYSSFILLNSQDNKGQCTFGIMGQDKNSVTLGDSFLTSAYVVFDLDNYEISMAQRNDAEIDESDKNGSIKVVTKGSIPGVRKATGYNNIWVKDEGISTGGDIFTATQEAYSSTVSSRSISQTSSGIGSTNSTKPTSFSTIKSISINHTSNTSITDLKASSIRISSSSSRMFATVSHPTSHSVHNTAITVSKNLTNAARSRSSIRHSTIKSQNNSLSIFSSLHHSSSSTPRSSRTSAVSPSSSSSKAVQNSSSSTSLNKKKNNAAKAYVSPLNNVLVSVLLGYII
ncbi:aspartic proteinase yapsin-3 [Monosporozyma servazzii]